MSLRLPARRTARISGALALLLVLGATAAPARATADRLVAVVNDEIITASELESARALAGLDLLADILPGIRDREPHPGPRATLDSLIDQRLLLHEAALLGVGATDEEARAAVQALDEQKQLENVRGASDSDVRRHVQEQLTIVKLVNREVRSKILLNAADVETYYRAHPDRFARPGRYRIRQIFLKAPADAPPDARAAAKTEAEAIRADAAAGGDFGELARRRSQGAEATYGGDLGWVRRGELLPEIDAMLERLQVGEISPVLETALGFHIINLVETQAASPRPLEDVKSQVEELVYQEHATDFYRQWIRQLRGRSHIDVRL
ncbi:MAG: peptidylprolyl isomerase [Nitrospirota bacterium]